MLREWQLQGLPNDKTSVESAIAATTAATGKWPLLIDPQRQACRWLKQKGKRLRWRFINVLHQQAECRFFTQSGSVQDRRSREAAYDRFRCRRRALSIFVCYRRAVMTICQHVTHYHPPTTAHLLYNQLRNCCMRRCARQPCVSRERSPSRSSSDGCRQHRPYSG